MVLLDADYLMYKIGYGTDDLDTAIDQLHRTLDDISYNHRTNTIKLFLSCQTEGGFRRKLVDANYKMNRKGGERPTIYEGLRKYMETELQAIQEPGLEADDLLGIYATRPENKDAVVLSLDKDLRTVPCNLCKPYESKSQIETIDRFTADYNHAIQVLKGDTSDGYKGIPGIGPVKAAKILGELTPQHWWSAILDAYENNGLTEEDALTTARLSFILRDSYYNTKTKEVTMWTPDLWDYDGVKKPNEETLESIYEATEASVLRSFATLDALLKHLNQ